MVTFVLSHFRTSFLVQRIGHRFFVFFSFSHPKSVNVAPHLCMNIISSVCLWSADSVRSCWTVCSWKSLLLNLEENCYMFELFQAVPRAWCHGGFCNHSLWVSFKFRLADVQWAQSDQRHMTGARFQSLSRLKFQASADADSSWKFTLLSENRSFCPVVVIMRRISSWIFILSTF